MVFYSSFFFFFSSRRRHTRSLRDWSSDVCSSDLVRDVPHRQGGVVVVPLGELARQGERVVAVDRGAGAPGLPATRPQRVRSEERRVGKECRTRWTPEREKKKKKTKKRKAWRGDLI